MRLLREITDEGMTEYNSLVFSTYSALNQAMAENQDRMYEAVIIAENNTEKLDYELRSLYHGIRGHLKNIRDNNDVNFLLKIILKSIRNCLIEFIILSRQWILFFAIRARLKVFLWICDTMTYC